MSAPVPASPARRPVRSLGWAVLATLLALLAGCAGGGSSAQGCERIAGVRPGVCLIPAEDRQPAPTQAMPVVGSDQELSLESLVGRVTVMNFWASWCGPCRLEQPDLNEAAAALPAESFAFLGVNIEDTEANALAHQREFDMPYASLHDPANDYASRFSGVGPRTIPTTLFLDAEGRVAARVFGVVSLHETLALAEAIATED